MYFDNLMLHLFLVLFLNNFIVISRYAAVGRQYSQFCLRLWNQTWWSLCSRRDCFVRRVGIIFYLEVFSAPWEAIFLFLHLFFKSFWTNFSRGLAKRAGSRDSPGEFRRKGRGKRDSHLFLAPWSSWLKEYSNGPYRLPHRWWSREIPALSCLQQVKKDQIWIWNLMSRATFRRILAKAKLHFRVFPSRICLWPWETVLYQ